MGVWPKVSQSDPGTPNNHPASGLVVVSGFGYFADGLNSVHFVFGV